MVRQSLRSPTPRDGGPFAPQRRDHFTSQSFTRKDW